MRKETLAAKALLQHNGYQLRKVDRRYGLERIQLENGTLTANLYEEGLGELAVKVALSTSPDEDHNVGLVAAFLQGARPESFTTDDCVNALVSQRHQFEQFLRDNDEGQRAKYSSWLNSVAQASLDRVWNEAASEPPKPWWRFW